MNLEHVKYNFTCEISHVKNHMFQIHMFNFTHVKSCGIFVRGPKAIRQRDANFQFLKTNKTVKE